MAGKDKPQPMKSVLLYSTEEALDLLSGLSLATVTPEVCVEDTVSIGGNEAEVTPTLSDKMCCNCCSIEFSERIDQIDHYKSDWHRFNLKQRLKSGKMVTEEQFEKMMGDDLSSISGSDSENSDESDDDASCDKNLLNVNKDSGNDEVESFHIEGPGRKHPRVFLINRNNQLISVYRCVLHGKRDSPSSQSELLSLVRGMPGHMTWSVIMLAGGHFAAAIFDKESMIQHKTFHRYVVRAKRGTAQSQRDKQGNAPKSAGASLRRYNETALKEDIQELLVTWSEQLKNCHRIFIRTPSYSRGMLFNGRNPVLDKTDPRIRQVPFPTRRPTCKELCRVHALLATIDVYDESSSIDKIIVKTPPKPSSPVKEKKKVDPVVSPLRASRLRQADVEMSFGSDGEEFEPDFHLEVQSEIIDFGHLNPNECTKKTRRRKKKTKGTGQCKNQSKQENDVIQPDSMNEETMKARNELYTCCKTGDIDRLMLLLDKLSCTDNKEAETLNTANLDQPEKDIQQLDLSKALNVPFGESKHTLLHVVAGAGCKGAVSALMQSGADPTIKDGSGVLPYLASSSKEIRNEFRQFFGQFPEKYNYNLAQIPQPLDPQREAEKRIKDAEKKRLQKKKQRERTSEKKKEEKVKMEEEKEKQRYLNLSDREKRALAAERRVLNQISSQPGQTAPILSRCFQCASDITGKVPFEYHDFKFCSPKCLKIHREAAKKS